MTENWSAGSPSPVRPVEWTVWLARSTAVLFTDQEIISFDAIFEGIEGLQSMERDLNLILGVVDNEQFPKSHTPSWYFGTSIAKSTG